MNIAATRAPVYTHGTRDVFACLTDDPRVLRYRVECRRCKTATVSYPTKERAIEQAKKPCEPCKRMP